VILLACYRFDGDLHTWDVPIHSRSHATLNYWLCSIFHSFSLTCTRISLLALYHRIFANFKFRTLANILIGANIAYCIGSVVILIFQCRPISYRWQMFEPGSEGKCEPRTRVVLGVCISSVCLDFFVLAIPLRILYSIRATIRAKLQLSVLLLAGLAVCISAVIRTLTLYNTATKPTDPVWSTYTFYICASLEVYLALISACVPAVKAMWQRGQNLAKTALIANSGHGPNSLSGGGVQAANSGNLVFLAGEDAENLRVLEKKSNSRQYSLE
jgi:hypothetical protein